MLIGLTNTLAIHMQLVNNVLKEYLDVFVVAYLDDILIYSRTKEEHIEHIQKVLTKMLEYNLLLNPKKCK